MGEPVLYSAVEGADADEEYGTSHSTNFSETIAEAFADVTSPASLIPAVHTQEGEHIAHEPSNLSQAGIVHLLPIQSGLIPSPQSPSAGSSHRGRASRTSTCVSPVQSQLLELSSGEVMDVVQMPSTQGSRPASPVYVSTAPQGGSASSMSSSSNSEGPHITYRYQHIEDNNGHHLILGREGEITNCEDEPIRTPGAVQGYGILVAVEEDEETGNLVVRQNSTELLGLSPPYLFSLDCFSQALPDQQADVLFDSIQYLSDSSLSIEEQAENVHVFMLSGFGEPGSAFLEDPRSDTRRTWTCWCAAHRPHTTTDDKGDGSSSGASSTSTPQNIIILEFELDRDTFNPLYPPMQSDDASSFRSGISSPSDGSAYTSNSSGRTLVSSTSSEIITPEDSTPSLVTSDPSIASVSLATTSSPAPSSSQDSSVYSLPGSEDWMPSPEAILESTTSHSKPLIALERLRRIRRGPADPPSSPGSLYERGSSRSSRGNLRRRRGPAAVGMMDVFAVMAQINEQLGAATEMDAFLKVVAGVIKDLTQFHRVLVYQFDELWNGQVVAELVDWSQTHDLFNGLHFPASDIPAQQARTLYALNKVRLLYNRGQPTARLVVRSRRDLDRPLDMTHCYLRAMSPIHLKYLENMGVRASMSVSIIAFGQLWGLVACHSYGPHGMRVSFPVRQMLRLLSQSISRNIERLSYAQRLHTRKLINTMPSDQHPSGYIVSNADDLLGLFDADYGVLVIGEGAKILGPNQHGQEVLVVAEYLRLKQFNTIQVSQAVTQDYPDLQLTTGLEVIAGLLYVPLSVGGRDFIAFLRKGQPRQVKWAGRPYKDGEQTNLLEPRTSFRTWSETVAGRCRAWSDEHLETAGVLALVYGKFIEVWRQKESALQTTKLTNILLSNASHEVRTPLNHIINYLELALNGHLDGETRENLSQSHAASKSLLFTINDLLDLTRLESGNETSFSEVFDLHRAICDATLLYRNEAARRGLGFRLDLAGCPKFVIGDTRKIRTVVANLTANALKYTAQGSILIECHAFEETAGPDNVAVEIVVSDTGCGISVERLESIFREFEQVESSAPRTPPVQQGLGLGLAVVARIVEQLGGQLRVDSRINEGSRFSFLIPFAISADNSSRSSQSTGSSSRSSLDFRSRSSSNGSRNGEIEKLVEALKSNHMEDELDLPRSGSSHVRPESTSVSPGSRARRLIEQKSSNAELDGVMKPTKGDGSDRDSTGSRSPKMPKGKSIRKPSPRARVDPSDTPDSLRVLIVEDNDINRTILAKRLSLDGHDVVNSTNGQEGVERMESDWDFDCILMDIQMPLLNGYDATQRIRAMEQKRDAPSQRVSHKLNGRIPIFAVSASLYENQREDMHYLGMDGWILKPIDFKRLRIILKGVSDPAQRLKDVYQASTGWEVGGWLKKPSDHL
ncbi:hypothetical protein B0H21DRAFT_686389 [Amylocystis lapponica]|nr:hypothetical protein B0H21DRAFT_686389 [Amylocystis lapponica]